MLNERDTTRAETVGSIVGEEPLSSRPKYEEDIERTARQIAAEGDWDYPRDQLALVNISRKPIDPESIGEGELACSLVPLDKISELPISGYKGRDRTFVFYLKPGEHPTAAFSRDVWSMWKKTNDHLRKIPAKNSLGWVKRKGTIEPCRDWREVMEKTGDGDYNEIWIPGTAISYVEELDTEGNALALWEPGIGWIKE